MNTKNLAAIKQKTLIILNKEKHCKFFHAKRKDHRIKRAFRNKLAYQEATRSCCLFECRRDAHHLVCFAVHVFASGKSSLVKVWISTCLKVCFLLFYFVWDLMYVARDFMSVVVLRFVLGRLEESDREIVRFKFWMNVVWQACLILFFSSDASVMMVGFWMLEWGRGSLDS